MAMGTAPLAPIAVTLRAAMKVPTEFAAAVAAVSTTTATPAKLVGHGSPDERHHPVQDEVGGDGKAHRRRLGREDRGQSRQQWGDHDAWKKTRNVAAARM